LPRRKSERTLARDDFLVQLADRPKSLEAFKKLYDDRNTTAYLMMSNVMAVKRLGYNDHGPVHAAISARNAVKILDLIACQTLPTIVREKEGDIDDSTLITMAGAYLHDIGNAVHRVNHEIHSIPIAFPIVRELTEHIYGTSPMAVRMSCEILSAIYSHEGGVPCVTVESGCVRVGDGTDMERGRARYPYDRGSIDIHSLSALAIEKVEILAGKETPVLIRVHSNGTAGIFQVEKVLGEKIRTSGIGRYVTVEALVDGKDSGFRLKTG